MKKLAMTLAMSASVLSSANAAVIDYYYSGTSASWIPVAGSFGLDTNAAVAQVFSSAIKYNQPLTYLKLDYNALSYNLSSLPVVLTVQNDNPPGAAIYRDEIYLTTGDTIPPNAMWGMFWQSSSSNLLTDASIHTSQVLSSNWDSVGLRFRYQGISDSVVKSP